MKIDLKTGPLYRPGREFEEVDVPSASYLAIDGNGDPNTSTEYADAVAALYSAAYAIRARLKQRTADAWTVGPLEGLWSSDDPTTFATRAKSAWDWTMLVALPEQTSADDRGQGLDDARRKKPELPVDRVEIRELHEGRCLQVLHVGSYDDEGPLLARLHSEVMPARGLTWNGPHHEIYLGDPRRTAPEKLRTILRQPVREH